MCEHVCVHTQMDTLLKYVMYLQEEEFDLKRSTIYRVKE